ncbi:CGNR zinc finger domain-containing protein [Streptomyces albipurpureus]|uniref:CGNR zinc finger domain-containing protein n=1 Tax=Streptomyces albipurpureus TaxID=2897419 RepID=A0ABT0USR9_9ACTN|nr:CGNR zinc finger domain-containing protein [Streptomyces sp. CWNU-1]MCM2390428.1 CGNR zinc finger domain-containing protein [Streptomyces sp. CWNU-1]
MESRNSEWSARHSVATVARRTAALVNALTSGDSRDSTIDRAAVIAVLRGYGEYGGDGEDENVVPEGAEGPEAGAGRGKASLPRADPPATAATSSAPSVPSAPSAEDIAQMRTAAVQLRAVFAAEQVDQAAECLNRLLAGTTGPLRLTSHRGASPWHPHLDRDDDGPWGEWLLASSALALTVLVWDRQRPPGGICASPTCRDVFLAQGSGPVRRYCSRRCATRERVAAHRRMKKEPPPSR